MFDQISSAVTASFPGAVLETGTFRNELTIRVQKERIREICSYMRASLGFNLCSDILGADRFTEEDRFEVIYNLFNLKTKVRVRLKVWVDESNLHVPSVVAVWPAANWYERETFDMFGIIFDGHPDLRRMYMPEDFEYFPFRKDFPLIGIPGSIPLPSLDDKAQEREAGERYNRGEKI